MGESDAVRMVFSAQAAEPVFHATACSLPNMRSVWETSRDFCIDSLDICTTGIVS